MSDETCRHCGRSRPTPPPAHDPLRHFAELYSQQIHTPNPSRGDMLLALMNTALELAADAASDLAGRNQRFGDLAGALRILQNGARE